MKSLELCEQAEDATIWRNRHGLATQLTALCQLYVPEDVFQFLCPLALELGSDMVAAVRHAAAEAVGQRLEAGLGKTDAGLRLERW